MIKVDYEDFIRLIKAEEKLEIIKRMTDKDECILSKTLKKIIGESDENVDDSDKGAALPAYPAPS